LSTTPESGMVQLLTHIRACGASFDRNCVHWFSYSENYISANIGLDYQDRIWFKSDTKWFKADKNDVRANKLHGWCISEIKEAVKLCFLTYLLWLMDHFLILTHKLSSLSLTDKKSNLDKPIGKPHLASLTKSGKSSF